MLIVMVFFNTFGISINSYFIFDSSDDQQFILTFLNVCLYGFIQVILKFCLHCLNFFFSCGFLGLRHGEDEGGEDAEGGENAEGAKGGEGATEHGGGGDDEGAGGDSLAGAEGDMAQGGQHSSRGKQQLFVFWDYALYLNNAYNSKLSCRLCYFHFNHSV